MRILLIVISAFFLFNSCSTELDVNADYRETPILFALFNQNADTNYVRLQKSFSNENSSALEIARNFDSLYYDTTQVKLELYEVSFDSDNGVFDSVRVDRLEPEYNTNKADGIFGPADGGQYVYRTDFKDWKLEGVEYILRFKNENTGLVATAKTDIVGCDVIQFPVGYQCPDMNNPGFREALGRNLDFDFDFRNNRERSFFEFQGPRNAAIFACEAIVEYTEDYIDDNKPRDTIATASGFAEQPGRVWQIITLDLDQDVLREYGENELLVLGRKSFGNYLDRVIDVSNDEENGVLQRNLFSIQFRFYYYNTSYENYLEVNGNFNPLSQTKPLYTNVVNGLGLVASRNVLTSPKLKIGNPANFSDESEGKYFQDWPQLKFPIPD